MRHTADSVIWDYAATNGFAIVTADSDFLEIAARRAVGPKVIRIENCRYRTSRVEAILRRNAIAIANLEKASETVLVISSAA